MGILARLVIVCAVVAFMPSLALAAKTHKVKKNETLYSLSKKYHVTTEELKSANGLVQSRLKPGDVLVIPSSRSAAADHGASRKSVSYKVKKGETLKKVSKKTGVSVDDLKRINHLTAARLKPGQVLALVETETVEVPARPSAKRYSA